MKAALAAAALLALVAAGCGRSAHDAIVDYCRGLLSCGVDTTPNETLGSCEDKYLSPGGSAHDQCVTKEQAVCLGNCYDDHGCGIFIQNDPCACESQDYGCPK